MFRIGKRGLLTTNQPDHVIDLRSQRRGRTQILAYRSASRRSSLYPRLCRSASVIGGTRLSSLNDVRRSPIRSPALLSGCDLPLASRPACVRSTLLRVDQDLYRVGFALQVLAKSSSQVL